MRYLSPLRFARLHGSGLVLVLAAGLLAATCAAAETSSGVSSGADSEVMARIGDRELTRAELEEQLAPQLRALELERQQALEQGIERWITEQLLTREMEAGGLTQDELLQREVYSQVPEPTDEEVTAFYEQNSGPTTPPQEQVAERIRQHLRQQAQADRYRQWLAGLREKYDASSLLEPLRFDVSDPQAPARGPVDAPVTLVEFSDFECPYCARLNPVLEQVVETYGDRVRLEFRHYPIRQIHSQAQKAAEAAMCADEQEKFWPMHDAMFADQAGLAVPALKEKAAAIGLDAEAFAACLDSGRHADAVEEDLRAGTEAGVTGTPTLFVNGRSMGGGVVPFERLAQVIEQELARSSSAESSASDS